MKMRLTAWLATTACALTAFLSPLSAQDTSQTVTSDYDQTIREHRPEFWWRMNPRNGFVPNSGTVNGYDAHPIGEIRFHQRGPTGSSYPAFESDNTSIRITRGAQYLRVTDAAESDTSPLRFSAGDAITIEAWVRPNEIAGGFPYIIGKGRTHNSGYSQRNQNYALRLTARGDGAALSFFFVHADMQGGAMEVDGHRWTSKLTFPIDGNWHHVAVTYTFGDSSSIGGWIDGKQTTGTWDLAGATDQAPVSDDDDVWIGSSMAGSNTLNGELDEVAIYRRRLSDKEIRSHVDIKRRDAIREIVRTGRYSAPSDHVRVDVYESAGNGKSWSFTPGPRRELMQSDVFALVEIPRKYDSKGLIADRKVPLLLHATSRIVVPEGKYQLRLRSLGSARLYVDDDLVAQTAFMKTAGSGHNPLYELPAAECGELSCPPAHDQKTITWKSDGQPHEFSLLVLVGVPGRPAEVGEPAVSLGPSGSPGLFLAPHRQLPFTDAGWLTFCREDRDRRFALEQITRRIADVDERAYWDARHQFARQFIQDRSTRQTSRTSESDNQHNTIDRLIERPLALSEITPADLISDLEFLRRLSLDVCGIIPTPAQRKRYLQDPPALRRWKLIDRLLNSTGWADHWVSYWQDVLAENPGLTKPRLNNSGPFRYFIHESFLDNKPFDRFVSELISMEGSKLGGGPAGFAMVTNNDSPMAARAHVIGTAFLAVQMKCARCHDAPSHESTQRDLFSVAAMLNRKALPIPASSSIPGTPEELEHMVVQVSLKPGEQIRPSWPFPSLLSTSSAEETFPAALIRDPDDPRERLAMHLTHPGNRRFAQVIVNRMWKRYFGRGLTEPLDDWESSDCTHPELLDFLASELVTSGYDLKHIARQIFSSRAYQRQIDPDNSESASRRRSLFGSAARRRLTAEQITDSVFRAVGKPLGTEELNVNRDGRQAHVNFINLGTPLRSWQLVSTSNERERPSMSLPHAQGVVDLLQAYGWRQNRQDPVAERTVTTNPLQPMVLANGQAAQRAIDISDASEMCDVCLADQSLTSFIHRVFHRLLTRNPTDDETRMWSELLKQGYATRMIPGAVPHVPRLDRSPLTWSNHLDPAANQLGMDRDAQALKGDLPTQRLDADWRERVEDMLWVLINSPEFVFSP